MKIFRSISRREYLLLSIAILSVSFLLISHIVDISQGSTDNHFSPKSSQDAQTYLQHFLSQQKLQDHALIPLRDEIKSLINARDGLEVSVYLELLDSGASFSINPDKEFVPGSLFKIPTQVAIMRAVERGEIALDQEVVIQAQDIDESFSLIAKEGVGASYTVAELIDYAIVHSDNTAEYALRRLLKKGAYIDAVLSSGALYDKDDEGIIVISAEHYANLLRSLYRPSYISPASSEYLLSIMSQSAFSLTMASQLPQDIVVAQKLGWWADRVQHHNCGIVFYEENPYLLCVMTEGLDTEEAYSFISELSSTVYLGVSGLQESPSKDF